MPEAGTLMYLALRLTVSLLCLQEAEALVEKLQQAALAPGVPPARARTPLLAAVDLKSRKRLHGHADGLGVSRNALSQVRCELPTLQELTLLVSACTLKGDAD